MNLAPAAGRVAEKHDDQQVKQHRKNQELDKRRLLDRGRRVPWQNRAAVRGHERWYAGAESRADSEPLLYRFQMAWSTRIVAADALGGHFLYTCEQSVAVDRTDWCRTKLGTSHFRRSTRWNL